jgi:xylitol oxidase
MVTNLRTWAGNLTYSARELLEPQSLDDLRRAVAGSTCLRALGTRHSFSSVADTTGDLLSVARLPRRLEIDAEARTATVSAGLRYGEVVPELDAAGLALANLGSLPHISVGGATATGTHGSGDASQVLASSVAAIELVTASGDVVRIRRDDERFAGAVIALGRLGVVTALTLDLVPSFGVRQEVHLGLPAAAALEHLDALLAAAYSVSLFTDWAQPWEFQVWSKHRTATSEGPGGAAAPGLAMELGARPAEEPWHPVPGMPAENCTEQLGVPGRWHARLPHFKLEFTPSSGEELQTEYFVARSDGPAALTAVAELRDVVAPVLQVSEIRSVARDELWLSPANGRETLAIHFTWIQDMTAALPAVRAVEEVLAPFAARPHWGKVFATPGPTVRSLYPRLADANALAREFDPGGTFRNAFVEEYLEG